MKKTKLLSFLGMLVILGCISIFGVCVSAMPNAKKAKQSPSFIETTVIENIANTGFQIGHSIRFFYVAEIIGDNPSLSDLGSISPKPKFSESTNFEVVQNRRTEIETRLSVIPEVENKPPENFDSPSAKFTDTANKGFTGFAHSRAREKV